MDKRVLFFIALFCFLTAPLVANEIEMSDVDITEELELNLADDSIGKAFLSIIDTSMILPESLDMEVDSLLNSWHARYFTGNYDDCLEGFATVDFPDSIYIERLSRLPRVIEMRYNQQVKNCIAIYVNHRSRLLRYMLGMSNHYFPMIEEILDEHNLPIELKYLAAVESSLNPIAVSRMGATGMWQFMLRTGKAYGLEINSLVDERRDPVKATHAACRYFKDMYRIYGDWNLVMASYNCGPGNVNKAIRRAGGKTDFWEIYPHLPRETRSYVPLFIAANYAMNYYCEHNICPAQTNLPANSDTIMVNEMLHLAQISETLNISMDQLRALNPQFKRDIVPGNQRPFAVNLPLQMACQFITLQDTIFKHRANELLPNADGDIELVLTTSSPEVITHVVKKNETLGKIARDYNVKVNDIMHWNDMKNANLSIGKRLRIYTSGRPKPQRTTTATTAQQPQAQPRQSTPVSSAGTGGATTYKVKSGDSLYTIAKASGTTVEKLKSLNNLSTTKLKIGQVLKIPKS